MAYGTFMLTHEVSVGEVKAAIEEKKTIAIECFGKPKNRYFQFSPTKGGDHDQWIGLATEVGGHNPEEGRKEAILSGPTHGHMWLSLKS